MQDAIKECMDQIEVSISLSMSGMSFKPSAMETPNSSRQYVEDNHKTSFSTQAQVIVVPNGNGAVSNYSSVATKTAYISSASTTPTDLMDVVSSATYVGAY